MTGLLSAVGSVSASRTVRSERFDCIYCYMHDYYYIIISVYIIETNRALTWKKVLSVYPAFKEKYLIITYYVKVQ